MLRTREHDYTGIIQSERAHARSKPLKYLRTWHSARLTLHLSSFRTTVALKRSISAIACPSDKHGHSRRPPLMSCTALHTFTPHDICMLLCYRSPLHSRYSCIYLLLLDHSKLLLWHHYRESSNLFIYFTLISPRSLHYVIFFYFSNLLRLLGGANA